MKKIGMITIGQSPRVDIVPEIKEILGKEIEVLEAGALDGLSLEQVRGFYPRKRDYILCTRMADGSEVVIGKRFILPRMQDHIHRLARRGAEIILLLCTGKFPEFSSKRLLIEPQKVLDHFLYALQGKNQRIGLMIPLQDQMEQAKKKYGRMKGEVIIQFASPYSKEDQVSKAAKALKRANPHVIVMHCMGYTQVMKDQVREITGKPVVLARSLVARALKELIS
jgi:protein AroM